MAEQRVKQVTVEIVLATPHRQELRSCAVPEGTTIENAILLSHLAAAFPELALDTLQVGIWGKIVKRTSEVRDGDRIELYRPLCLEPREARRRLAMNGGVMGTGSTKDPA